MQRGYTLIELLVVLALLGVLATAMLPLTEVAAQRAREAELKQALWQIREAIDAYKAAHDAGRLEAPQAARTGNGVGYPPNLLALVEGVGSSTAPGGRVYFLRRLPRDPFADPALPAAATWGLRSYQSPPDKPAPGEDVYDVYSRSERVGLNGVPLRAW